MSLTRSLVRPESAAGFALGLDGDRAAFTAARSRRISHRRDCVIQLAVEDGWRVVRKHPLIAFFVLAYLLTWWIYPVLQISPLLGIFGLFGPALAAMIMAAVTGGKAGLKALLSRAARWRVGVPWYVIALGLPTVLSLLTAALAYLFGASKVLQVGALSIFDVVLFILVVGEELGWRGYALPLLLEKRSPITASLILGVVWGLWHLPTFLVPGTPQYGLPLTAFVLLTIEYSILMTWVFLRTLGSVLIATLFHGAINLSQGLFLGGLDRAARALSILVIGGASCVLSESR